MRFLILVPAGPSHGIDQGAAMVTPDPLKPIACDRYMVHYESNRYGVSNMQRFVEKVFHAAARAVENYPTLASSALLKTDFKVVGKFDYTTREITEITDPDALREWVGDIGDLKA